MATWTWNPSDKASQITLSDGNLTTTANFGDNCLARATSYKSSGKWYWEITTTTLADGTESEIGIGTSAIVINDYPRIGSSAYGWSWQCNGYYGHNGSFVSAGTSFTDGDIIQIALDLDSGKLWFGKNGTWNGSGNPATGANPVYTGVSGNIFPMIDLYNSNAWTANFGASAFSYTEPEGFSGIANYLGTTSDTVTLTDATRYYRPYTWVAYLMPVYLKDNDLTAYRSRAATTYYYLIRAKHPQTSGKWYWEITINSQDVVSSDGIGVGTKDVLENGTYTSLGGFEYGWEWRAQGQYCHNGNSVYYVPGWEVGDVVHVALDLDNGKLWFGKNGTWNGSGDPANGTNPIYTGVTGALYPGLSFYQPCEVTANFGDSAFTHSVPTGFNAVKDWLASTSEETTITDEATPDHLVELTEETLTLTDEIIGTPPIKESIAEDISLTDEITELHLVDSTSETATLTDESSAHRTTYASISEIGTLTDVITELHLVDETAETATITDDLEFFQTMVRNKVKFPNLQGQHISLKFANNDGNLMALYYLREKMYKTRNLCSDQKHPNTQGNHIGLKLSNSGTDNFILMYLSQEHYMVDT